MASDPSPAPNRVTPFGEIEAFPLRGAFTGNRGIVHAGRTIVRPYAHDSWVICALRFNDRWNEQWLAHRLTWLFFYDEAVGLAAGHRPCGECRRRDYELYRNAWTEAQGGVAPSARAMNRQLHRERIIPRERRRRQHEMAWASLPEGAFVALEDAPWLIAGPTLVEWTREGYRRRRERPGRGLASVITPPSSVAVLTAGYPVQIDPSARSSET